MTDLEYFNGNELAASVWRDKYALCDEKGNRIEKNPSEMHRRLAKEFARIEASKFKKPYTEDFIYDLFDKFERIIPQGSPMYAVGNPQYASTSNCFVVTPPEDSYSGIMLTDEEIVQISKRRGGVGTDLSKLRPVNTPTTNAAKTSSGVVSFMERYSNTIREVGQFGRRAAGMLTISVHHPQVIDFAEIKLDPTKVTGANVSIRLTNEFLTAVKNNTDYEQRWPVDSATPVISRMVSARAVWKRINECAHARAEPGLLFWDNILAESIPDCYADVGFETVSTNP